VRVEIYSRAGCHLCEDAERAVEKARALVPFDLQIIDVDSDPALQSRYGHEVPVILIDGKPHAKYVLEEWAFLEELRRSEGTK
jgi:glutaredoxin